MMVGHFEGPSMEKHTYQGTRSEYTKGSRCTFVFFPTVCYFDWCNVVGQVTIDKLPDDALLEIFDYYVNSTQDDLFQRIEVWHMLVHVCRKWRNVVFGSPLRLNLRLSCSARKPVRENLNIWPELPIVIRQYCRQTCSLDNILAALEHNDRVLNIALGVTDNSQLQQILPAMTHKPFPVLTDLILGSMGDSAPEIPDSFLGGSAPLLRSLWLSRVPFPGLPKLLLSATQLVELSILNVPHSRFISPAVMTTCLAALTRLERLELVLLPPGSSEIPPPHTRSVLPAFTYFKFSGINSYLGDLVACIDAPLLNTLDITFRQYHRFDSPHFSQFISRTVIHRAPEKARVALSNRVVTIILSSPSDNLSVTSPSPTQIPTDGEFALRISFIDQISPLSLAQVSIPSLPPFHTVRHLYIRKGMFDSPHWQSTEISQWFELLRPFTAVKDLYLSEEFVSALEFIGEREIEVLPALQNLFLSELESEPVQKVVGKFVAARRLTGHDIAISSWEIGQNWPEIDN
jgi:F-box-like